LSTKARLLPAVGPPADVRLVLDCGLLTGEVALGVAAVVVMGALVTDDDDGPAVIAEFGRNDPRGRGSRPRSGWSAAQDGGCGWTAAVVVTIRAEGISSATPTAKTKKDRWTFLLR
jgi:hypothetical protein